MAGLHNGFPDLALLLLAVTHDAVDVIVLFIELAGQRLAHCY